MKYYLVKDGSKLKIGRTTRNDVEARMRSYKTHNPDAELIGSIDTDIAIDKLFYGMPFYERIDNTEWAYFSSKIIELFKVLQDIQGEAGDKATKFTEGLEFVQSMLEKKTANNPLPTPPENPHAAAPTPHTRKKIKPRRNISYAQQNEPQDGEELTYLPDSTIKVKWVAASREARYKGKLYSLSKLVAILHNNPNGAYPGPAYFAKANGQLLRVPAKKKT